MRPTRPGFIATLFAWLGIGLVTFLSGHVPAGGASVRAGFLFDVPVRFDTDYLEVDLSAFAAGSVPRIPLVEIKV